MTKKLLDKMKVRKIASFDCEESCITIIAVNSTKTDKEVLDTIEKDDDATLADVGYSPARADGKLRPILNRQLRIPYGRPIFIKDSFKDNTMKVRDVVIKTCN